MKTRRKKAIVGIEAAIVLIAFVIVAAALAFVALNMGLFTTQKSKETIQRGLGEASSALEVDGAVTGVSNGTHVDVVSIPIKVSPGREAVDLATTKTTIRLLLPNSNYEEVHTGVLVLLSNMSLYDPVTDTIVGTASSTSTSDIAAVLWAASPTSPEAYVVFIKTVNDDTVLEFGEKAVVIFNTGTTDALAPYDTFTLEIRPPQGSPLTIDRMIPATLPSTGGAVDLG